MHHAYSIEGDIEGGIREAYAFIERELGMKVKTNPDVITFRYGLLSVDDARRIVSFASQAPINGDTKAVIIAASRAYHEAQNALLKLFEEPPEGTFIFLILPSLGMLLSTLRSRIQILEKSTGDSKQPTEIQEIAEAFLEATREKRSAMIKNLASGKDEDERREHRDEALAILDGVERAAYAAWQKKADKNISLLLSDISTLRGHLHDRSAPLRMILEHLSLLIPKGIAK